MRIIILALLFLPLSSLNAAVYTWIDEEGNTHFSDKPQAGAKKIKLKESSSYTPPATHKAKVEQDREIKKSAFKYTEILIDEPENDATVRSNEGKVPVSIRTKPRVQAEHEIQIYLDDTKLADTSKTGIIELRGVERGTHNLVAAIVDKNGKELIRSDSITFHLLKISTLLSPIPPIPTPLPSNGN